MKYCVGDKVKIHTLEWFKNNCSKNCIGAFVYEDRDTVFVNRMTRFCGKEITINNVSWNIHHSVTYNILEDDGEWNWEDWMFEDMNNNTNTISNSNIIEEVAKLIGVELGEEFYDKEYGYRYKITSMYGVMFYNPNTELWQVCTENTFFKMVKEGKFIKKWTPQDGERVYFPVFNYKDLWNYKIYDSENEHDKEMLKSGLYFKTQEEAIECAKKIIKQMKEG